MSRNKGSIQFHGFRMSVHETACIFHLISREKVHEKEEKNASQRVGYYFARLPPRWERWLVPVTLASEGAEGKDAGSPGVLDVSLSMSIRCPH